MLCFHGQKIGETKDFYFFFFWRLDILVLNKPKAQFLLSQK